MKYIAPEMEMETLYVEEIMSSSEGSGNQGGVNEGGGIEFPDDPI